MSRNFLATRIGLALVVIALLTMGTPAFAQGGTVVRVDPASPSAQVNDTVNLTVKVDNISNLAAFELHLSFNPAVLEVTQLTNGGFVAADFTAQSVFDNGAGTIDYAVAQLNRPAAQGNGTLLNIAFHAKANGVSTVTLRGTQAVQSGLLLSDANGSALQASWSAGTVNVGNVTITVTPVTPTTSVPTTVTPATSTPTPTSTVVVAPTTVTPTSTATATATSTSTATPLPTSPAPGILGTHIVRWGESVYCIGRAYRVSPQAIAETNHLWFPNLIFPYQSLLIPNVPWSPIPDGPVCQVQFSTTVPVVTPTPTVMPTIITPISITSIVTTATVPPPSATPIPASGCRYIHTVAVGENLFRIGLRYGVSYTDIARANNIPDARVIYVGQLLCIP